MKRLKTLKAIAKVLKIQFETEKASSYDPGFVKKVLQGRKDIQDGKGVKVNIENLWKCK